MVDDATNESCKTITQINQTDRMMSRPRMEIMNNSFGCSRATQVLMETPETVNSTEFIQGTQRNEQISLLMLWMYVCTSQQSNLKVLMRKLTITQSINNQTG